MFGAGHLLELKNLKAIAEYRHHNGLPLTPAWMRGHPHESTSTAKVVSLIDVATYLPENRASRRVVRPLRRRSTTCATTRCSGHRITVITPGIDESNVDMIERAAAELVARHGPDVLGEVDVLLTHSQLPDLPIVGAGGEVAKRLGISPGVDHRRAQRRLRGIRVDAQVARSSLTAVAGAPRDRSRAERRRQDLRTGQVRKLAQASVPGDGAAVGW